MAEPEVALITGTSRGLGNHLAHHLLERGYRVVGCSRTEVPDLQHERYVHRTVDVSSEADVVELFRFIRSEFGRLDVAINNAAINPTLSLLALTPTSAASDTFATNVIGPFLVCREAVKVMMRGDSGRIINVGSMATRHEVEGEAIYTASKAALNALTRVLAKEVAEYGITCNVVAPAAMPTDLMAAVDPAKLEEVLARNAIREVGAPEDLARVVDSLIGPEAAAITGQVIYLGGA